MARGAVQGFSINDIFEMLSATGKTGMLDIRAEGADCQVFFSDGKVFYATSANARLFLGERLVEEKMIEESDLMSALEEQSATGNRIGRILIEREKLGSEVLNRFLKDQIVDELYRIIELPSVQFNFVVFEDKPANDMGVYLDTKEVVREAEAKSAEWQRIQQAMPSSSTALILNDELDIDEIVLSKMEWKVLAKTAKLRSVGQIVEASKEKEFDILKNLLKLLDANMIKKEEFKKAVAPVKTVDGKGGAGGPDEKVADVHDIGSGKYVKKDKKEVEDVRRPKGKDVPIEWESYLARMDEEVVVPKKA